MSTGKAKCGVRDGLFIEPCDSLVFSTEYGNPRGKQKGIWMWNLWDMDTHKPSRSYFGTKSGDHVQKGLLFNFCPFCGEKIDAPFTDRAATNANAQDGPAVDDARDAARYRWLRNEARATDVVSPIVVMMDCGGRIVADVANDGLRSGEELDDAVDAAMSASRPDDKGEHHG